MTFTRKKKKLDRLVSINLSVNKLYELMNNGLVDKDGFLEIGRVSLLTRSNFKTTAVIDIAKTKANCEGKDIFLNGDFQLFVEESQYISRDDLYVLSRKNRQTYEKELRP
ncbi:hypothetical protein [Vagococcus fluvialis]|uniref:hypothetical protein n=1 Tax=Vagococcus fluvialis TaxID=2738 RepID=UPI003B49DACE